MSVKKIIEVLATSEKSFDDAANNAVREASKTVQNIKSVYVKDMKGRVEDGRIVSYGVIAKITFELNPGNT